MDKSSRGCGYTDCSLRWNRANPGCGECAGYLDAAVAQALATSQASEPTAAPTAVATVVEPTQTSPAAQPTAVAATATLEPSPTPEPTATTKPTATNPVPTATPKPTQPPKPTPTAAPEPEAIITMGKYRVVPGNPETLTPTSIVGYVTNTGNVGAENVQIVGSLVNAAGKTVGTGSASYFLDVIPAGGKSPFYIAIEPDRVPKYEKATFDLSADPEGTDEYFYGANAKGLTVEESTATEPQDEFSSYTITGRVKNAGKQRVNSVEVLAIVYDDEGVPIDVSQAYANLTELAPGRSSPFSVEFSPNPKGVENHEVYVEGSPAQ